MQQQHSNNNIATTTVQQQHSKNNSRNNSSNNNSNNNNNNSNNNNNNNSTTSTSTATTIPTAQHQQQQQQQPARLTVFYQTTTLFSITVTTLPPELRQDLCFKQFIRGQCVEPISDNVTRAECCCSNIAGVGWSAACQGCPVQNTGENKARFPLGDFFAREQAKSECNWVVMSSVFVASQSSCFFLCSREQIRLVDNRLDVITWGRCTGNE